MAEVKYPDPSALGLFGLAIATLVACTAKFGITTGTAFIIPWVLFLGAGAQFIAGLFDFNRNNIFGGTVFCGFALFWAGVAMSWMIGDGFFGTNAIAFDGKQLGFAFLGYFIFAFYLTFGAMEASKVLFFIFVLLDILFLCLTLNTFGVAPDTTLFIAAIAELLVSLLSFYGSAANVLENHFGRPLLPVGKGLGIIK